MRAQQVIEEHGLLRDRLSTPAYQRYMQTFMADMAQKKSSSILVHDEKGRPSGWHFCNREMKRLEMAESYYVSADMVQVARWAGAGLDGTDRFRRDLWPTDYGFMWLDGGVLSQEIWGRTIVTQALSWGRVSQGGVSGFMVVSYTDLRDERDEVNNSLRDVSDPSMGHLHVNHVEFIPDDMRVGPAKTIIPADYAQWAQGDQKMASEADNGHRLILAVLMLLNQTVSRVTVEDADKRIAKRAGRAKVPPRVTVIELRRQEGSRSEGESMIEWTHRWIVRGHWAWRACSENHPFAEPYSKGFRARVYVAPFVKGPDGAPLKQSTKVYSLIR